MDYHIGSCNPIPTINFNCHEINLNFLIIILLNRIAYKLIVGTLLSVLIDGKNMGKKLVQLFKNEIKKRTGKDFPTDPWEQLWGSISAVFGSWNNQRALTYRKLNNIPAHWGTAVNVQAMVFGNMGDDCATGVAFTRDPATGENRFFGEYLVNAQGEDVVAGTRTPQPVNEASVTGDGQVTLKAIMPGPYQTLEDIYLNLEKHYTDMQDIEFTIENGTLWMLQTRTGKRTVQAALKIAVDMVDEGLIDKKTAVLLYNNGITTIDLLIELSLKELTNIRTIFKN